MNEVGLGVPVPSWICLRMVQLVGQQTAERILCTGTLLQTQDAREAGLIDGTADTKEDLEDESFRRLRKMIEGVHEQPQVDTLRYLREDMAVKTKKLQEIDIDQLWNYVGNEKFRDGIRAYLAKLSKK